MFDTEDIKNWRILGFTVTIFASDLLQIFLDDLNPKEIQISSGVIDILLEICKYFSIGLSFNDDGLDDETIFDF